MSGRRFSRFPLILFGFLTTGLLLVGGAASAQEVRTSANGDQRVLFNNGCVVHFDNRGRQTHSRNGCNANQIDRARDAIVRDRQRSDQGPNVQLANNGEGRVVFSRNGCTVLFDRRGRVRNNSSDCTDRQLRRAREEMAAARARYGFDRGNETSPGNGPPRDVIVYQNGSGRVVFRNGCEVTYDRNGQRRDANQRCNRNFLARADSAMADRRQELGLWRGQSERRYPPRVARNQNGSGEVTFRNGCIIEYNRQGERRSVSRQCTQSQKRQANETFARARRDDRQQRRTDRNDQLEGLTVHGLGRVSFSNGCVVKFDRFGVPGATLGGCSDRQRQRANVAMARKRAQLGCTSGTGPCERSGQK